MNHKLTQLDLQTVLAFERIVYGMKKFSVSERWAVNQERSILLQPLFTENRKSMLRPETIEKIKQLHQEIKLKNWEIPDIINH
jgi:hypothetical protein